MKNIRRYLVAILAVMFMFSAVPVGFAADTSTGFTYIPINSETITVLEALKLLDVADGWIGADATSVSALDMQATVATGMVVHPTQTGTDSVLVLRGDVLSTGKVGISQLARLAASYTGKEPLEGASAQAADVNADGSVDLGDLIALASFIRTGSLPGPVTPAIPASDAVEFASVSRAPLTKPDGMNEAAQTAAEGANDFAFCFSSALLADGTTPEGNFVCSPYSVWLPLAALLNATDEAVQPQLLEALGSVGISAQDVNLAASRMLYGLTGAAQNDYYASLEFPPVDPLQIANAIFVNRDRTVDPEFAQVFASNYLGDSISVDFTSQDAVDIVNQWCDSNTNGMIPRIIDEFDPNTEAAIANAIYFSDRWDAEFDPDNTEVSTFHATSGDMQSPFMQRLDSRMRYYEDEQLQAVDLPFATEGGLAILLPKDNDAAGLLSSLTGDRFSKICSTANNRKLNLRVPRFEIDGGIMNLSDSLQALGVPLFDREHPAITKLLTDSDPLFISDALQGAKIKVDENGTTAAAVTLMPMEAGAALDKPEEPLDVDYDHPFVFVLYGSSKDAGKQVLFTGVVGQPEAA